MTIQELMSRFAHSPDPGDRDRVNFSPPVPARVRGKTFHISFGFVKGRKIAHVGVKEYGEAFCYPLSAFEKVG